MQTRNTMWFLLVAMAVTGRLVAADYTWMASPLSANWLLDANWNSGAAWADGHVAVFGTSSTKNINLNGNATASGVTVTAADYTLGGNGTLTLNGPFNVSADVTATVTAPLASTSQAEDGTTRFAKRGDGTLVVKGNASPNVFYRMATHGGTLALDGGVHEIACASTSPGANIVPLFMEREGRLLVEGGAQLVFTGTSGYISNPGGDLVVTNGFVDAWNVGEFLNGFADQNTAVPAATISRITLQDAGEMRAKVIRLGKVVRSASYYGPEYGTIHLREGGTLCVRGFTMDISGSGFCGALDFEGGRLVITNDMTAGKETYPFSNAYKGHWTNVLLRVHEGGVHLALSGLAQASFLYVPFISAAEHDGGFHFYGGDDCYIRATNTFNGGLHLDGSGILAIGQDSAMGVVPATPAPSVFFNSSAARLHFDSGDWSVNKNRDFIINTNITAQIGVQDQCRTRIAGVITGHGDGGHLCTLHAISRWPGCLEIGPADERTNTIGRLRVEGHLRHVAGTTLITSNAPGKISANAPFYVAGNGSSYQSNMGVFEVAGGTVKVTQSCFMDVKQYGQVIVTNGLLDAWNTAEYLNAHPSPARLIVGGNGTMTCRLLRISQCDRRGANGEPRAEVSVTTGGVLKLDKFRVDSANAPHSCGILNLDGGVVVSQRNEENFLGKSGTSALETTWQSKILVRAGAGGAIIDTEAYSVTVKAPLRSGAAADGGLVKRGAGTLIMASTNSYNGATRVESGQLVFTHVDGLPPGALEFSAGAVASEDKTTPHLVANSWAGNTVRLTDAANLPDTFTGEKILATFTVPLTATPALELVDADGNTVSASAWRVSVSSDGTSLLLRNQRGTMIYVR